MNEKEHSEKAKRIYADMLVLLNVIESLNNLAYVHLSDNVQFDDSLEVSRALGALSDKIETAKNNCEREELAQ